MIRRLFDGWSPQWLQGVSMDSTSVDRSLNFSGEDSATATFSDNNSIQTTLSGGTAWFLITGDNSSTSGGQVNGVNFTGGQFDAGGNDAPLVRTRSLTNPIVAPRKCEDFAGEIIQIDSSTYRWVVGPSYLRPWTSTELGVRTRNSADQSDTQPNEEIIIPGTTIKDTGDGFRNDGAAADVAIGGWFEGAVGTAHVNINNGSAHILLSCRLESTASGSHGIYLDSIHDTTINASRILLIDGDDIRITGNASKFNVADTVMFQNITEDSIHIEGTPGSGGHGVVPREETVDGTVTYPSGIWRNMYYNDGGRLIREGTDTINAGSSVQVTAFGGEDSPKTVTVGPVSDPGSDVDFSYSRGWDASNGQETLSLSETSKKWAG